MLYFEVEMYIPKEKYSMWFCIKGERIPNVREVSRFMRSDELANHGRVVGVYLISKEEAVNFYDFGNEENWPILK